MHGAGKSLRVTLRRASQGHQIENNRGTAVPEIGRRGDTRHAHERIDERPNHSFLLTQHSIEEKSNGLARPAEDERAGLKAPSVVCKAEHGLEGIEGKRLS